MSLRLLPVAIAALLAGCGGDGGSDGDTGAACGNITLDVTVADPAGNPLEGVDVNIDNETSCTDNGGGAYTCTLPGPGTYKLYAEMNPEYVAYGSQFEATCEANPMSTSVTLNFENGGL